MTLFERAAEFAIRAHSGTVRKKEHIPYILHPMEVASIAATMSHEEELLAAAMLHDTVEDTDTSAEEIMDLFGSRVAELVASETEDKHRGRPATETWAIRKEESIAELKSTDDQAVKILWLSDKLSNMRSFHRMWLIQGDDMWKSFHQTDPAKQAWYYRTIMDAVSELREYDAWKEYRHLVEEVFQEV